MFFIPDESWEVRDLGKIGKGVFAKTEIEAGSIIGDYIGRVIPMSDENNFGNDEHLYLMYYSDKALLYPDLKKPGIHLLNHSCTPNCWMYTYKGHTLFFCLRKIFPGEELSVSYLLSPLDKSCKNCSHSCLCAGELCFQSMHLSSKRYKEWSAFHDAEQKKTQSAHVKMQQYLPALNEYPKSINDDPIYTLFGSSEGDPYKMNADKLPKVAELRKLIRKTGRRIYLPKVGIIVSGIYEDKIVCKQD